MVGFGFGYVSGRVFAYGRYGNCGGGRVCDFIISDSAASVFVARSSLWACLCDFVPVEGTYFVAQLRFSLRKRIRSG